MMETVDWAGRFSKGRPALPGAQAPWLSALRQRALDRFVEQGWPTPKQENWRHTSLGLLAQQSFAPADPNPASHAASVASQLAGLRQGQGGHWLVFVDGHYLADQSEIGALPQGVRIQSLAQALAADAERLRPYLGDEKSGDSPAALNLALTGDGAYIDIGPGAQVDEPIHLLYAASSAGTASFPRTIVVLKRDARATVIEHYIGQGGASLTNAVFSGSLERGAELTHIKVQQEHDEAFHLSRCSIQQDEGSTYTSHSMAFGARLARNDIDTRFNGVHCHTLLNGLYYADGRRHVDHHTTIDHAQPHGASREYYRGILDDGARGVFTGRIRVLPGADGTDAVQRSDSLLLSRTARSDARPELEIYTDDVKCAHGATVGQIDEQSLFYLRSRGLDQDYAQGLLTYAFAATAVERIALEPVRKHVAAAIKSLLPGSRLLGDLS